MKNYSSMIRPKPIPAHVAIIMDGNGRWAKKHNLSRSEGHKKGAEIIEPLMDTAIDLGIKAVSLYAFSTENWVRPRTEILGLWKLLDHFFTSKLDTIKSRGISIRHSGSLKRLPSSTRKVIERSVAETRSNKKLVLNFCINYGGRQEILEAANRCIEELGGKGSLTEKKLERFLYTSGLPEVDLLIRTSGEYRISNFLLWQIAYAEMVFMDVLWPDFTSQHLYQAIYQFQQRERRFGGL
jgi:undecaprenyl diphosphate synthase